MDRQTRINLLVTLITLRAGVEKSKINMVKLSRQVDQIIKWLALGCKGYLEAITGYGKTWVAVFSIYFLNLKYSNAVTHIIVPTIKLKKDWEETIITFGLKNCKVFVVNTYTMQYEKHKCILLVMDEAHHYVSDSAEIFSKVLKNTEFQFVLALSATLRDTEKQFLESYSVPCIDVITKAEGKRMGFVSDYITYNFGIQLNETDSEEYEKLNDIHNSNFSKFNFFADSTSNWELIRACTIGNSKNAKVAGTWKTGYEWKQWYATEMGWDGTDEHEWSPKNISKYAQTWNWAMTQRKNFLYNNTSKLLIAKKIIKYINVQTITFAENTSFVDDLVELFPNNAVAYHSNLETEIRTEEVETYRKTLKGARNFASKNNGKVHRKGNKGYRITYNKEYKFSSTKLREEAIRKFQNEEVQILATAKALDEGVSINNIALALICSATSKSRQYIQRLGRAIRFVEGKTAYIINLYIKDTKDEHWLKQRQRTESGVKWIDSIDQIKLL